MAQGKPTRLKPASNGLFSRVFGVDWILSSFFGFNKKDFRSSENLLAYLSGLQTNILFADHEFKLVYANPKAIATLTEIEYELKKAFGLSIDQIIGESIHRFHKDSRRVEKILQTPTALPYEAEFSFGAVVLKTKINAAYDSSGKTVGYVVNWDNITEIKKTEAKVAQVLSMMKKMDHLT